MKLKNKCENLLGALGGSLFCNMLTGKGINRAEQKFNKAGCGSSTKYKDF